MIIPRLSFSRIDTFSRCPQQYVRDVLAGRSPPNKHMLRGTHLHDTLEHVAKRWLENGNDWPEAFTYLAEAPPDGVLAQGELESYLARAVPMLEQLKPVAGGVEAWFDSVGLACELPELRICGKIDLISETSLLTSEQSRVYDCCNGPAVVDYKTITGEHRIKSSAEAKRSMQLKIYCLATGLTRAGFIYFPPKSAARATFVEFSESDLRIAHRWLTMQIEAIKRCWNQFLPKVMEGWTFGDDFAKVPEAHYDWSAWPVSNPDNFLCSKKWCEHFGDCLGAS